MPRKGQLTGIYVACENCGKIVYKTQTAYKRQKNHYCSNKCQLDKKHKDRFEIRKCEICGKEFEVSKINPKRFCSIKCQSVWQKGNTGTKNKKFQGDTILCGWCGKKIAVGKYKLEKGGNHFCSNECRRGWYSNVFSQSDEWRETSRKRATKQLQEKEVITETKPQIMINKLLDSMGIKYINEKDFTYYSIDNYLPDYNLAIEVMGDFWHCNPLSYPNGTKHEIQKNRIPKDRDKRSFLREYYNVETLYLWETDIYNDLEMCKKLIHLFIKNKGKLQNYNSFNYCINENGLSINENIIYPYYEVA